MALRIPWNDHESAFLLHMLIEVLQKKIDRKTAISITSRKLRQFAITNGIDIDEKFRNENGIRLQMGCLEYAFTGGASGLPAKTGWYYKTVGLYRDHPEQFDSLVKEVVEMDGAPGMKDWSIRNCLSYILRDSFEFTGALVSKKGSPISTADIYREFCSHHEVLTLEQLKEFSAEIDLPIYCDDVLSVMVQTSADEMRRTDGIHFDIEKTDAALDSIHINQLYCGART